MHEGKRAGGKGRGHPVHPARMRINAVGRRGGSLLREWLHPKVLGPLLLALFATRAANRAEKGNQQVATSVAVMSVDQGREAGEMDSLRLEVRRLRELVLSSGESGRRDAAKAASPPKHRERRPADYALAPLRALGDAAGAGIRWLFGG